MRRFLLTIFAVTAAAATAHADDGAEPRRNAVFLHGGYAITEVPDRDAASLQGGYVMLGYERRLSNVLGLASGLDYYQGPLRFSCANCPPERQGGMGVFVLLTVHAQLGGGWELIPVAGASLQAISPLALVTSNILGCDVGWHSSGWFGMVIGARLRLGHARFDDSDFSDKDSPFIMFSASAGPVIRF